MFIKYATLLVIVTQYIAGETDLPTVVKNKLQHLIDAKEIKRDFEAYREPELHDKERYDFIVVGAGSAGSALINRLSEQKQWKILVLEAGGEPNILTDIPIWAALSHFNEEQNWGFLTEKEENFALGFKDERMRWPRGKGLGGTSLLNYMVASRGVRHDYDTWASQGNPGWSYNDLLPIFKRLENCKIKHQDEAYRGHDGELHVEDSTYRTEGVHAFLQAAQNLGYKYLDYNGREHVGVSYIQTSTKNGLRCSGERCFIRKAKNRDNLVIRMGSHVTKVLIGDKNKAYGVEFVKNGRKYVGFADKEVILCAGVINSAHILLLSGVGPSKDLQEFGITPIKNLPVGKKIYDHPTYWGLSFTADEPIGLETDKLLDDQEYLNLFNKGNGRLNNIGGVEGVLFATTPLAERKNLTDVEILYWSTYPGSEQDYALGRSMGIKEEIYDTLYKPLVNNKTIISAIIMLMRPESYGYLKLQSSDPFVHPKIYGGYFTDQNYKTGPNNKGHPRGKDVATLIAGIREAIRVFQQPSLAKYGIKLVDTPIPGCETFENGSDDYWECALRHLVSTIYHHTTTCKMGPESDPEAVVDADLRVYGVGNLRVADTSVIPVQISGHTNLPAYMIGEKCADIVGNAYREKKDL